MSTDPNEVQENSNPQQDSNPQENQAEHQEVDPNALTEQDQQKYQNIVTSINHMNQKIKRAKQLRQKKQAPPSQQTKELTDKIITSKQNSEIVTKQDLMNEVTQSFEKFVVQVYSENKTLKKHVKQLQDKIRQQNHKLSCHIQKQDQMQSEIDKLRQKIKQMQDNKRSAQKEIKKKQPQQTRQNKGNKQQALSNEDYDFWSMPQNQSYVSKKKDFVADSGLWANQKDIGQSMFITQQQGKSRR